MMPVCKCEGYEEPCKLPATECFDDGENLHAFCDKHYERVVADFKESE